MSQSSSRIEAFDSIRGLAACAVVLSHLLMVMDGQSNEVYDRVYQWSQALQYTPLYMLWSGQAAVVLFFVLSGFVLYLLMSKAKLSFPAYAAKRVVRLYVPYLGAVALGVVGVWAVSDGGLSGYNSWISKFWSWPITGASIRDHLLFVGQFNSDRYDFTIWTLIHEMRISLLFPLIFLMVSRMRWWTALAPFAVISMIIAVLRQPAVMEITDISKVIAQGGLTAYMYTAHYLLAFAVGATLARYREALFAAYQRQSVRTRVLLGVLMVVLYVYGRQALDNVTGLKSLMPYDWLLLGAASLMLIMAAAEPALRRQLERPSLLYLGRISYSLYLFHPIVLLAMLHSLSGVIPLGWLLLVTFLVCFIVSDIAYRLAEKPAIEMSRLAADRVGRIYERLKVNLGRRAPDSGPMAE